MALLVAYACDCNAVLGSDRYYAVPSSDGGGTAGDGATLPPDADRDDAGDAIATPPTDALASDAGAPGDAPDCDTDSTATCYACAPTTPWQLMNACTTAACAPFDDARLTHLLADGALPPLPSVDAGDASGE